jgi:hypothetical protein
VTTLRSSLSIYILSAYNNFFLLACFVNISPEITFRTALVYFVLWTNFASGERFLITEKLPKPQQSVPRNEHCHMSVTLQRFAATPSSPSHQQQLRINWWLDKGGSMRHVLKLHDRK